MPTLQRQIQSNEPYSGKSDAPFKIVMYGDYQDETCKKVFKKIDALLQADPEKIFFVWRHFPLNKIHQRAQKAAELAIAAHQKGMFWEVHRLLIEEGSALNLTDLIRFAKELGFYDPQLYNALMNNTYAWDVRESITDGVNSGVKQLPAIFLNGSLISQGEDITELENKIKK